MRLYGRSHFFYSFNLIPQSRTFVVLTIGGQHMRRLYLWQHTSPLSMQAASLCER